MYQRGCTVCHKHVVPALLIALLFTVWVARLAIPFPKTITSPFVTAASSSSSNNNNNNEPSTPSSSSMANDLSYPDAPFVGWPLRRACAEVPSWDPTIVWLCDNNWGGVGNVRNFILTCLRYAIEGGVGGIVLPAIQKRDDADVRLIDGRGVYRPFGYLFDEAHFRRVMADFCPQMAVYDNISSVPGVVTGPDGEEPADIPKINPETDPVDRSDLGRHLDPHTDRFHSNWHRWLSNNGGVPPPGATPRLFRMIDYPGVLWAWPTQRDGSEFENTFAGVTRFNQQVMRLGRSALAGMRDLSSSSSSSSSSRRNNDSPSSSGFFGIHLRTEDDVLPFWPTYEEQRDAYLARASETGYAVAYVASGNLTDTRRFADAAAAQGMAVATKRDVLSVAELEELDGLSWDQQALVDYYVLTQSGYFVGNGRSSFSISVQRKRHLKADGLYARPFKVRPEGFETGFMVGPKDQYYMDWLYLYDAMWP